MAKMDAIRPICAGIAIGPFWSKMGQNEPKTLGESALGNKFNK